MTPHERKRGLRAARRYYVTKKTDLNRWKSIRSCPRQKPVLVWWPLRRLDAEENPTGQIVGGHVLIASVDGAGRVWDEPPEIDAVGSHMDDDYAFAETPSHWMELPKPPAEATA